MDNESSSHEVVAFVRHCSVYDRGNDADCEDAKKKPCVLFEAFRIKREGEVFLLFGNGFQTEIHRGDASECENHDGEKRQRIVGCCEKSKRCRREDRARKNA